MVRRGAARKPNCFPMIPAAAAIMNVMLNEARVYPEAGPTWS
jgi:hypothetical protein